MPQYFAPGVYVEEISSGTKPIAGVGTSTAGLIGLVADTTVTTLRPGRNPLKTPQDNPAAFESVNGKPALKSGQTPNKTPQSNPSDFYPLADAGVPQQITSWESFTQRFGEIQAGNAVLAHAVYGFFNNGGTRCYVIGVRPAATPPPAGVPAPATAPADGQPDGPPAGITAALSSPPPAPTNDTALIAALDAFRKIDEIAIVAIPGATSAAVQNALIAHCEREDLQDRFAVLDGKITGSDGAALSELTKITIQGDTGDSSYGAVYFPWISVFDPLSGGEITVPPSGHIAGVYARVDATRGVHKAPANEVIRGALGVSTLVGKADQAGLNPEDINVIRKFGGNITLYGARTLKGKEDPEWKYINVRRLFLFLRKSIDQGTQWVVFEPNDEALWGKIRRNISAFLTNVWRSGALFGSTPEEAFFVRCDASTNPKESRDQGLVVTEIGVAVVNPAEFVVFRISQWSGPSGK